ncbi:hypothetical protein E2I00_019035, partial [Balaenoptera physalus]
DQLTVAQFNITIDNELLSFMKIFSDKVLKIAENVWSLKTREKGLGNFTHNNDTGGKAIFQEKYAAKNIFWKHTSPGTLSKANVGSNTSGSRVFICPAGSPMEVVKAMDSLSHANPSPSEFG